MSVSRTNPFTHAATTAWSSSSSSQAGLHERTENGIEECRAAKLGHRQMLPAFGNNSMPKLLKHFDDHHPDQGLVFNQKYGRPALNFDLEPCR
jgi:hypothetical protein